MASAWRHRGSPTLPLQREEVLCSRWEIGQIKSGAALLQKLRPRCLRQKRIWLLQPLERMHDERSEGVEDFVSSHAPAGGDGGRMNLMGMSGLVSRSRNGNKRSRGN